MLTRLKFLGPLSELYGRSLVLQLSNLFYLGAYVVTLGCISSLTLDKAWNLGCGFAQNKSQLIAFRFLAGVGGSAPLSVRFSDRFDLGISLMVGVGHYLLFRLAVVSWAMCGTPSKEAKQSRSTPSPLC